LASYKLKERRADVLARIPSDLSSIYGKQIKRIKNHRDEGFVINIFSWIYHTRRPLSMGELREAVSIGKRRLRRLPDPSLIVERCQGLLDWDRGTDTVSFMHYTARDESGSHFDLYPPSKLAKACLTYLSFDEFENFEDTLSFGIQRAMDYKFYEYAATFWGDFTKGEGEHSHSVQRALVRLFSSDNKKRSMLQMVALAESSGIFVEGQTMLHLAAERGLAYICEQALQSRLYSQQGYRPADAKVDC
jgi:hypothetical protein